MLSRPQAPFVAPEQVHATRRQSAALAFLPAALAFLPGVCTIAADVAVPGAGVAPALSLAHSAKPVTPRDRLLRLAEVEGITGLRKSCLYRLIQGGKFPASVRLTARSVAWSESAVHAWVQARIQEGVSK
jgi:prophage regulatory protein